MFMVLAVLSLGLLTGSSTIADTDDTTRPYGALLVRLTGKATRSSSSVATTLSDSHKKIVGGEPAAIKDFPWVVGLVYMVNKQPKQYCGGTLILPQWVLTAAHCPLQEGDLVIWGAGEITAGIGQAAHILCFARAAFDSTTFDQDVALVKLDKSLPITPIDRARSTTYETTYGHPIRIVGWGRTDPSDPTSQSNALMKAEVNSADLADCMNTYSATPDMVVTQTMFCAQSDKAATCIGDSGGPALLPTQQLGTNRVSYALLGIISWGQDCTQRKWPGVYTRVGQIEGFVEEHLRSDKQCQKGKDL